MISAAERIVVMDAEEKIKEGLRNGTMTKLKPMDRLTLLYASYLRHPSEANMQRIIQWAGIFR